MKKVLALLTAALLLLALCACELSESVSFKNELSTVIHSVYISPVEDENWTDPLNYAKLSVGSSIFIDTDRFVGSGTLYDVGVVDENNMNYDVYDVPLSAGDTLTLKGNANGATLTVKTQDGGETTYTAYIYEGAEE